MARQSKGKCPKKYKGATAKRIIHKINVSFSWKEIETEMGKC